MEPAAIVDRLARVREDLDRACQRLTAPTAEVIEVCSGELESAARQLIEFQPELGAESGNAAALEEAWRVRRSFLRARKLIQGAAMFHGNWMRLRGTISGGYTPSGEPAPVLHGSRICLQA
jgi:uncharacterized membrane protein YccC